MRLRASRSFHTRTDYETFVGTIVQRMKMCAAKFLDVERSMLKPLPVWQTAEFEEISAWVSRHAIFTLKGILYGVPGQLIGHRLMVCASMRSTLEAGWVAMSCESATGKACTASTCWTLNRLPAFVGRFETQT